MASVQRKISRPLSQMARVDRWHYGIILHDRFEEIYSNIASLWYLAWQCYVEKGGSIAMDTVESLRAAGTLDRYEYWALSCNAGSDRHSK